MASSAVEKLPEAEPATNQSSSEQAQSDKPTNETSTDTQSTSTKPGRVSKSKAIRDTLEAIGRDASAKEVISLLAARGIEVVASQVSAARRALRGGQRRRKRRRKTSQRRQARPQAPAAATPEPARPSTADDMVSIEALFAAKAFAARMGGVAEARRMLDLLERLM